MKPGRRRLYSALAAAAGFSLILFELRDLRRATALEFWFWLIVGIILTIVGTIEFLSDEREIK